MTFTHKAFNLDLRHYDTDPVERELLLSSFTGDPNARPGGRVDPVTNPDGLVSRWCGATFVAEVLVRIEPASPGPGTGVSELKAPLDTQTFP